jgi:hypothetical protein
VYPQKLLWGSSPIWQLHSIYSLSIRPDAQVQVLIIVEEFGVVLEKLRDKFFDVSWVCLAADPLFVDAFEEAVWIVEFSCLKFDHPLWFFPHEKANHIARTTVVSAVQVSLIRW